MSPRRGVVAVAAVVGWWTASAFRQPVVRLAPVRRGLTVGAPPQRGAVATTRSQRVVRMGAMDSFATMVWKAITGVSGTDVVFIGVFGALFAYKMRIKKKGTDVDPDAPKLSGFSYQFVAQTPEDEAKLKTMYCDNCGFTIFVAKNRFKKHFRDGLRCLNCGAVAPTFYNKNDPDDPLNKEGASIDDFDEAAYFDDSDSALNQTEISMQPPLEPVAAVPARVVERPVFVDEPAVAAEPPVVEKEPVVYEEPVVVEKEPVAYEEPVVVEKEPVAYEEPVVVEKEPVVYEEPVVVEKEPVVFEEPVLEKEPVVVEEPIFKEPVVVVEEHDDRPVHQEATNGKKAPSLAESYKGKSVPAELQIFRDLDVI